MGGEKRRDTRKTWGRIVRISSTGCFHVRGGGEEGSIRGGRGGIRREDNIPLVSP